MKKTIFAAVFAMAAVFGMYVNHFVNFSKSEISEIMKANIEALALEPEVILEGGVCYGAGPHHTNVYCSGGGQICCWAHTDVFGKN